MPRAIWNGKVVAESDATQMVEGNHYFPPDSIRSEYFLPSSTTSVCGWKGQAHYYSLQVEGKNNPDAAWYYPEPKEKAANIRGHIAFWKGVSVEDTPGQAVEEHESGGSCEI
ncbi:MAG: DUF427 domain-containing protein [bacterium]|nr:DUF427 domain-containing protein [bacterium]